MRFPLPRVVAVALVGLSSWGCALSREAMATLQSEVQPLEQAHRCVRGNHPPLLILALDGVDRRLLYPMLEHDELPELARLLGGSEHGTFPHAYFDHSVVATFPSITAAGFAAVFTGKPPAANGVAGDEFFIRDRRVLATPVPAYTGDAAKALSVYADGYADQLLLVPTVYQRIRAQEPDICAWVMMSQFHRGADLYLHAGAALLEDPALARVGGALGGRAPRQPWADLDRSGLAVLEEQLHHRPAPQILTVYLVGTDVYTHQAEEGADAARQAYLHEVVDPAFGRLRRLLGHGLAHRYVLITSDHGMSDVPHDERHALDEEDGPPAVVKSAGYRLRPYQVDTKVEDYQAVLAYQGAAAFVYVADRSTCPAAHMACSWERPPRYGEDLVPLAQAFLDNDLDGRWSSRMQGALDMILVRTAGPKGSGPLPFEVYVGDGQTVPVERYLDEHPHPNYQDFVPRLRDLTVGPAGDRAGDLILLAHSGDRQNPAERFYFSRPQYAEHGSPSRGDSDVTLIVAHPDLGTEAIAARVRAVLGKDPRQQRIGDLIVRLREDPRITR